MSIAGVNKILQLPVEEVLGKGENDICTTYNFQSGNEYRRIHLSWAKGLSGRLQGKTREEIRYLIQKEKFSIDSSEYIQAFSRDTRLCVLKILEKSIQSTQEIFIGSFRKLLGLVA